MTWREPHAQTRDNLKTMGWYRRDISRRLDKTMALSHVRLTRKEFVSASFAVVATATLVACSGGDTGAATSDADSSADESSSSVSSDDVYSSGVHHATIEVANFGTISVALNATAAPITVSNFAGLVNKGFYNGLTFHRVISGFMIQGGDPKGDGTGGSDVTIKGEFSKNGVNNPISHVRGVISMARSTGYDSASSQFFIMQKTNTSLDGQYAAFGNVSDGMSVVDAICATVHVEDSNGTVAPENQPVISSIVMVD